MLRRWWIYFHLAAYSPAKVDLLSSLILQRKKRPPPKTKHLLYLSRRSKRHSFFFFATWKLLWVVRQTLFRRIYCLSQLSGRLLSRQSSCGCVRTRGDRRGRASPCFTLSSMLLSGSKPALSLSLPRCSCGLPPCWRWEMDRSRWPSQAASARPARPHAAVPHTHSVASAPVLPVPRRRASEPPSAASRSCDFTPRPPCSSLQRGPACLVGRDLTACSFKWVSCGGKTC